MKTLTELNRELLSAEEELEAIEQTYKEKKSNNALRQSKIKSEIALVKRSVNPEKIRNGLGLLKLKFPQTHNGFSCIYKSLVDDAKRDVATGCNNLKHKYIGQKRYDGFDQREDHRYGYGPRHGYIYQSIGLVNPKEPLNEEQAETCLYLLENIDAVVESLNER